MRLQGLKNKTRFWSDLVGSVHYSDGYESFVSRSIWQPVESQPWKEYAVPSEIFVESLAWDLSQDLLVIWGGRMDRMGFLVAEAAIHLVSLSTGKPHPQATKPWFDLEGVPEEHVDLLILGDILVHRFPDEDQGGALSVWNWKSGVLLEELCSRRAGCRRRLSSGTKENHGVFDPLTGHSRDQVRYIVVV